MRLVKIHPAWCGGLVLGLAACSDVGTSPADVSQVSLRFATRTAPAGLAQASLAGVAAAETYSDGGGNTLVLDRVQLVMREIELENETHQGACEIGAGDDGDCAEVGIGPLLVDLPLGAAGAARPITADVPAGMYDEVKFKIREPDDDTAADAAFVAAHPEFTHLSVRADGSYNGVPFTYTSDLRAELKLHLSPPLVVGSGPTELTLFVDLGAWFRTTSGALVDPSTAGPGGANEVLVATNVERAFGAFEEDGHEGSDDHGGDDGVRAP